MRRSLIYFWRINLAVLLGAAVATAVLTGALLVGDSVRGSLRDLTLERLGRIDFALVAQKYFRTGLATEIASTMESIAPAIILNGSAVQTKSKSRASRINILGVDERFSSFFAASNTNDVEDFNAHLQKQPGQIFPSVVINESLQRQLNARVGDAILLSFQSPSDVQRASLLGRKKTEDVVESVRLTLAAVIPDRGLGRFSLRSHQALPLNAYVFLPVLQNALDQSEKVNALFAAQSTLSGFQTLTGLRTALNSALRLEDFGLFTETHDSYFSLESREAILGPRISERALAVAGELGLPHLPTFTYLANEVTVGDRLLPYSTVCAIPAAVDFPAVSLILQNGEPAPALSENEILLNQWAADDLGAKPGDQITMTYFVVGARDELVTDTTTFLVKGVLQMKGLAADPQLTPEFPGIADADNMADWDPPFPVDLNLIRTRDEAYWDQYRGAPKAFVAWETGRKLWGSRFGNVSSLRIAAAGDLVAAKERFESALLQKLITDQSDFVFQPVKRQGLDASTGATDFSTLFLSFSFFLIASAALLVGLLFRLGVEQRVREIGTRLAVGFAQRRMRWQFLAEGGLLAAIGAGLGLAGATLYAWLIMVGLRNWSGLFGPEASGFLSLHITPASLFIGYVASLLVIAGSIFLALRKLSRLPVPALLAGVTAVETRHARVRRITKGLALSTFFIAAALTVLAVLTGQTSSPGLFFGVGALLLISGLSFFSVWLKSPHKSSLSAKRIGIRQKSGAGQIMRMAMRNAPRNPGRSMLSAALVGCACFVIIAVEAFRHQPGAEEVQRLDSGAGGYTLSAEADTPLHFDLNSASGRFELGFSDADSDSLKDGLIMPFRLRPGDDASCLNLY
ncbi:MAG TPA: ABC transporter permease, partial [bacterium]